MIPHKCPVCEGSGKKPASFYGESTNTGGNLVQCKSCYGTGIVWDYSTPPYNPFPYIPPNPNPYPPYPIDPFNPWGPTIICDTYRQWM